MRGAEGPRGRGAKGPNDREALRPARSPSLGPWAPWPLGPFLLALAAGCTAQSGTLQVTLTTAPGSHVLDAAQELRLVITNPHRVVTAKRGAGGFSLALDVPGDGATGQVIVDALDGSGAVIATGESPAFAVAGIDAKIVVYMAAPESIGAAPVELPGALSEVAAGPLSYGAVLAGGRDAAGAPSDLIAIYNAYDHTLLQGLPLPAPRADLVLAVGSNNGVYLFGGLDATGAPADTLWRFDTNTPPSGAYVSDGEKTGLARAGAAAVAIAPDDFLVAGMPAAELTGATGSLVARTDIAALPPAGAAVVASDGTVTALFAGMTGVVRFRGGTFDMPPVAGGARAGAGVVALPGGQLAISCGAADGVRVDAATGAATPLPGVPGTAKTGCAIAATPTRLVIAGGTLPGGAIDPTVSIYDAATLAPVATASLVVPRTGAIAVPLANGQILIAGGVDATGAPVATLELYTPTSPE